MRKVLRAVEEDTMDYKYLSVHVYTYILHITELDEVIAGAKPEWVSIILRTFFSATPSSMAAGSKS